MGGWDPLPCVHVRAYIQLHALFAWRNLRRFLPHTHTHTQACCVDLPVSIRTYMCAACAVSALPRFRNFSCLTNSLSSWKSCLPGYCQCYLCQISMRRPVLPKFSKSWCNVAVWWLLHADVDRQQRDRAETRLPPPSPSPSCSWKSPCVEGRQTTPEASGGRQKKGRFIPPSIIAIRARFWPTVKSVFAPLPPPPVFLYLSIGIDGAALGALLSRHDALCLDEHVKFEEGSLDV